MLPLNHRGPCEIARYVGLFVCCTPKVDYLICIFATYNISVIVPRKHYCYYCYYYCYCPCHAPSHRSYLTDLNKGSWNPKGIQFLKTKVRTVYLPVYWTMLLINGVMVCRITSCAEFHLTGTNCTSTVLTVFFALVPCKLQAIIVVYLASSAH